ncbi:DUF2141 domain-containing protein [bacterium]|nr:DUF2141 domain-containing protein [bacterium]
MQIIKIKLGILGLLFSFSGFAAELGDIKVMLIGFKSDQGQAMLALHNTKKTFLKKKAPFRGAEVMIKNKTAEYVFKDVPYGEYSIAVFHDENSNMDLDANILGIPKEDYGFSNNAWRKYGPPKYKQTLFTLDAENMSMDIKIKSGIEKD